MDYSDELFESCALMRRDHPLVLNITNYVAMNFSANALTALGASPLMSFCSEEIQELVCAADSLVVNIGCLDRFQVEAMRLALTAAKTRKMPWVLDPVGVGASRYRLQTCKELIGLCPPAVIRGNVAEIQALASGDTTLTRGVDARCSSPLIRNAAVNLSQACGSVVVVSGKEDLVADHGKTKTVPGGSDIMPLVSAMGCTASALLGAFLAVDHSSWSASLKTMTLMKRCGEAASAALQENEGTGSFMIRFLDALSRFARNE